MRLSLLALLLAACGVAQASCPNGGHCVVLTITAPSVSASNPGTATILKVQGTCPEVGVPQVANILANVRITGTLNYQDAASNLQGGTSWCYFAFIKVGATAEVSNTFQAVIPQ